MGKATIQIEEGLMKITRGWEKLNLKENNGNERDHKPQQQKCYRIEMRGLAFASTASTLQNPFYLVIIERNSKTQIGDKKPRKRLGLGVVVHIYNSLPLLSLPLYLLPPHFSTAFNTHPYVFYLHILCFMLLLMLCHSLFLSLFPLLISG
jgi:hypothetical protein